MAFTVIANATFAQYEIKLREDLYVSKLSDTVYVVTHYFPCYTKKQRSVGLLGQL